MTVGPGRNKVRFAGAAAVAALVWGISLADRAFAQDDWRFDGVERVVAIGDIHGAYGAFEAILKQAGLIDDELNWQGGATHLVSVGDVLDRGPESRRALDLIRKLEGQAAAAGGQVHLLLGNHEIMDMTGDLRYVSAAEYAAFADSEPADIRAAELKRYLESFDGDEAAGRAKFDARYPPGYFAHREAFSPTGEYGSWLLEKPVLLVINDIAFVHGGLAGAMVLHGGDLNDYLRAQLRGYLQAREALIGAGLIPRTAELYDLPGLAKSLLEGADAPSLSSELEADAKRLVDLESMSWIVPNGPVWYRGNVGCNRLTEQDRLAGALDLLGARHLVVGHTPTQGGVVLSRMNEMLLRVDTGMLHAFYGGRASALIIEGDKFSVIYADEPGESQPLVQPRRVGIRPGDLSAEELAAVLGRAEVDSREALSNGAMMLGLADGDLELKALFTPAESQSVNPAVAAYRLDRLLELDMVPVTVAREIDGEPGALQYLPDPSIDESQRSAQRLGVNAWCPLSDQFTDMYLFDSLIFNHARTADRIRYSTDNLELLLIGNNMAFSTDRGRPAYLAKVPVELTPAWREALGNLDEAGLTSALGDVLDRRRIRALLSRRDNLLEIAQ